MCACDQLHFLLAIFPRAQRVRWCCPYLEWVSPPGKPPQEITDRHAWRFVSYIILDPVRLTIPLNLHGTDILIPGSACPSRCEISVTALGPEERWPQAGLLCRINVQWHLVKDLAKPWLLKCSMSPAEMETSANIPAQNNKRRLARFCL